MYDIFEANFVLHKTAFVVEVKEMHNSKTTIFSAQRSSALKQYRVGGLKKETPCPKDCLYVNNEQSGAFQREFIGTFLLRLLPGFRQVGEDDLGGAGLRGPALQVFHQPL